MSDVTNHTQGIAEPCGGDKAALLDLLYGEISADDRLRVEAHLASCVSCRVELEQLRATRAQLAAWRVPDPQPGFARIHQPDTGPDRRRWIMPAGLAAAAVLVLAAGAAIANLDIRYDDDGLSIRTGWNHIEAQAARSPVRDAVPATIPVGAGGGSPWRDDLAALEHRLRTEFTPAVASPAAPTITNAELLRRVQALIEESEARQRRELALRVAQVVRDVDVQRQSDLVRIQRGLGALEGSSAADRQLLNYLMRVSTPRQ